VSLIEDDDIDESAPVVVAAVGTSTNGMENEEVTLSEKQRQDPHL